MQSSSVSSLYARRSASAVAPATTWQRMLYYSSVLLMLLLLMVSASSAWAEEDYLDPEEAFQISAAMASPTQLAVHFEIAPNYYMYRDRFELSVDPSDDWAGDIAFPPAKVIYDENFDADMATYRREVTLLVPIEPGSMVPLHVELLSQGCADAGLCYTPIAHNYTLTPTAEGYRLTGDNVKTSVPAPLNEVVERNEASSAPAGTNSTSVFSGSDTGIASYLSEASFLQIVGLSFVLGLMLSFTPCVLPMVPILLGIIAGGREAPSSRLRGLALAAVYVLGVSIVYTLLGVAAGLLGASLAIWLQNPWVLSVFAVLLVLLALSMFDVYQLQVPSGMQSSLQGKFNRIPGGRFSGVFLMGMLSALIVGPCVAAPLAGVLLFISQTGDVVVGGSALFALAWGSGVLLLVVGATSGALMPKMGEWMNTVKHVFGVLLVATAWWMVNSFIPSTVFMLGWAFIAVWLALVLGIAQRASAEKPRSAGALALQAIAVLCMVWAVLLLIGVASGSRSVLHPLDQIKGGGGAAVTTTVTAPSFERVDSVEELEQRLASAQQPVMLDFYADWCVSCIEMEKFTFTDATVAQQMRQMLLLQADVTKVTPEHRALLKRFQLFGPPGIIFFDAQGNELSQRVVGFQPADRFSEVLAQVLP